MFAETHFPWLSVGSWSDYDLNWLPKRVPAYRFKMEDEDKY